MKILVFAPHADDAEVGMGGTISRLVKEGNKVKMVAAIFTLLKRQTVLDICTHQLSNIPMFIQW